ncbi:MAG: hypothetical protein NC318_06315 [Blautia sp.]|nr:hypothetical protein [Lachnoclostridium sp.]MCM1211198.1 hypothetical protein [Blautia sp.]
MEDIRAYFKEDNKKFTVYVVEQDFAIGRGLAYFKSFRGKSNYIDTDTLAQKRINRICDWIEKKIPPIAELVKIGFGGFSPINLIEVVVALNKLFGSQEHRAAGPEVIDPIIIQEGKVIKKYITQLVNLHKDSFLAPTIIIILKDNDFDRAKELLSECPDGTMAKFIKGNGTCELHRVINTGAENVNAFINAFAMQCFSTCSKTKHDVLLNQEWADNSIIKLYAPRLLRYRANLLCDEKNEIKNYLNECISQIETQNVLSENEDILRKNFLCIAKLYRVFCNDYGSTDMEEAYSIAKELDSQLLLAYVYKYAYFFGNKSINEQNQLLAQANQIFVQNEMADNAIYCQNNILVRQFDYGKISTRDFSAMLGSALNDVPGLVGMSHLYNNTGIAYMMSSFPDRALEFFDKGLEYANTPERQVQYFAILCNRLITRVYYAERIDFSEIQRLFIQVYDGMILNGQLPFISARYIMNLFIVAVKQNRDWAKELLQQYDIIKLINEGLKSNLLGSGQLLKQLDYLDQIWPECKIKSQCCLPPKVIEVTGRRKDIIERTGLNPFYFFTWL